MQEEEKSKPQATKAAIDRTDLVQAQKDKRQMDIIERKIQDGKADAA